MPAKSKKAAKPVKKAKKAAKSAKKPKKASLVKVQVTDTVVVLSVSKLGFAASIPRDFAKPIVVAFTKNRSHMEGRVRPAKDDTVNKKKVS